METPIVIDLSEPAPGRRFLLVFALIVVSVAALVTVFNCIVYFGRPFPAGTPPRISFDFGVDLLPVADAEMRVRTHARRLEQLYAALGPA